MPRQSRPPNLRAEQACWGDGEEVVVGIDEVGRGAWAGPLTLGAVILRPEGRVNGIRDSKMLTPDDRFRLFDRIADWSVGWGVGHASHEECDRLGMSAAQKLAARRAIDELGVRPDRVLLDGKWNFVDWLPSTTIVRGDRTCLSIAAASIMAKVTRDRLMVEAASHYPPYGFDENKGYPAPIHQMALAGHGACPIHRKSWVFMDDMLWTSERRYDRDLADQGVLFAS